MSNTQTTAQPDAQHALRGLQRLRIRHETQKMEFDALDEQYEALLAEFNARPDVKAILDAKRALVEQIEATTKEVHHFHTSYGGAIYLFARAVIEPDGESRTWNGPCKVQLRHHPARLQVIDEPKAIAWAEQHQPAAVKKSLLISKIEGIPDPESGISLGDPTESLYVDGAKLNTFSVLPEGRR